MRALSALIVIWILLELVGCLDLHCALNRHRANRTMTTMTTTRGDTDYEDDDRLALPGGLVDCRGHLDQDRREAIDRAVTRDLAAQRLIGRAVEVGRRAIGAHDPPLPFRPLDHDQVDRPGLVVDLLHPGGRQVCVNLRRRERLVAQQLLDGAEVRAVVEEVGRERVPQRVR